MTLKHTPLNSEHQRLNAKLVDFAGWEMPLHYGSQLEEHHAVRQKAGLFDVSHMGVVEIAGEEATAFLRKLLANDIAKLKQTGRALYSCLLNNKGGVLDDLIVYYIGPQHFWVVVNAATREKDLQWFQQQGKHFKVVITPRPDLCILALQGPEAISMARTVLDPKISNQIPTKFFHCFYEENYLIACTGYTGENGLEFIVPTSFALSLWKQFIAKGAKPCGLGARDTLRLEGGLNLYGTDMDEKTTPFAANLAWTVCLDDPKRNFIGKEALQQEMLKGVPKKLIGVILESGGVLRNHQAVFLGKKQVGEITSGGFSPTLNCSIGMARVMSQVNFESVLTVERRGEPVIIKMVSLPFLQRKKNNETSPIDNNILDCAT